LVICIGLYSFLFLLHFSYCFIPIVFSFSMFPLGFCFYSFSISFDLLLLPFSFRFSHFL
jgi:hypothetical protein